MRALAVGVVATVFGTLVALLGVAAQVGALPRGPDAAGFAVVTAGAGLALVGLLYWPVLARLRRRGPLSVARATAITVLALNAPVYGLLMLLGRDRALFAGGEALPIGAGLACTALAFGVLYAHASRAGYLTNR